MLLTPTLILPCHSSPPWWGPACSKQGEAGWWGGASELHPKEHMAHAWLSGSGAVRSHPRGMRGRHPGGEDLRPTANNQHQWPAGPWAICCRLTLQTWPNLLVTAIQINIFTVTHERPRAKATPISHLPHRKQDIKPIIAALRTNFGG